MAAGLLAAFLSWLAGSHIAESTRTVHEATATVWLTEPLWVGGVDEAPRPRGDLTAPTALNAGPGGISVPQSHIAPPLSASLWPDGRAVTFSALSYDSATAIEHVDEIARGFSRGRAWAVIDASPITLTAYDEPAAGNASPLHATVAGLLTAMAGAAAFTALEARRRRLNSPGSLATVSGLPILGETERVAGTRVAIVDKTDASRLSEDPLLAVAGASLSAARRSGDAVVTITSAMSGEGRSHLAASLAVTLGNRGLRVVLVELDGRGTRAGRYLGFHDGRPGVVEYLDDPSLSPADLIQNTQSPGVAVVPMGSIRGSLDLASARARLPLLMAVLLERADVVVVDAPPVLQGEGPGLISTLPGIAVMAVAARRTGQRDAVSSVNALRESGVRLTGYVYASLVVGSSFPHSARARIRSLRRSLPAFIHNLLS